MRILLHPGFHKTGTSSLQRGALAALHRLEPFLRLLLTPGMALAARAARRYSAEPTAERLDRVARAFDAALAQFDPADARALLISSEDLCGYLPGLHGVQDYRAAPALVACAAARIRARFDTAQLTVWFTTRDPAAWLQSLYWQNLRAQRLTEDADRFCARLAPAADLDRIVTATRDLAGGEVRSSPIETCGAAPCGPLGTALGLLGLGAADPGPLPRHNIGPRAAAAELLALNRSDLSDEALREAKRAVLRRYRRTAPPQA